MPYTNQSHTLPADWRTFWRANRWFFSGFGFFLIAGAIALFLIPQGDEVLWFSDRRTPAWDVFFTYFTMAGEEYGFLVVALLLVGVRYRSAIAIPVLGIVVTLVTAFAKNLFRHPRPVAWFEARDLGDTLTFVEGVRVNVSQISSFPSGHTMAGFALFAFLAFVLPRRRWVGLGLLLVAFLIGLSRIYLVQHFLKDIYLGAILGVACAVAVYFLHLLPGTKSGKQWWDRRIHGVKPRPSRFARTVASKRSVTSSYWTGALRARR